MIVDLFFPLERHAYFQQLLFYVKTVALNHCDNLLKSNFIGIVGNLNDQLVGLSIGHTRQVLKVR